MKRNRLIQAFPIGTMVMISGDDKITQADLDFEKDIKQLNTLKTNGKKRLDKID